MQSGIYDKCFDRDYVGQPFYLEEHFVTLLSDGYRKSPPNWGAILGNITM